MKRNNLLKYVVGLFVVGSFFSCTQDSTTTSESKVAVIGINLNKMTLSLKTGERETIVATIMPAEVSNRGIVWFSSDDHIAVVSSTGKVVALGLGTATITARSTEDNTKFATATVTITVAVTGLTLDNTNLNLKTGGKKSLQP